MIMKAQTAVPIGHAYAANSPVMAVLATETVPRQTYTNVVRSRDMYRRLYDQNTAALARARGNEFALQTRLNAAERELEAHRKGAPAKLLDEAMAFITEMVLDHQELQRSLGGGVRLPDSTIEFTAKGEALLKRVQPALHGDGNGR